MFCNPCCATCCARHSRLEVRPPRGRLGLAVLARVRLQPGLQVRRLRGLQLGNRDELYNDFRLRHYFHRAQARDACDGLSPNSLLQVNITTDRRSQITDHTDHRISRLHDLARNVWHSLLMPIRAYDPILCAIHVRHGCRHLCALPERRQHRLVYIVLVSARRLSFISRLPAPASCPGPL